MVNPNIWQFYVRHFGTERLAHYLNETSGDEERAMRLYRWNSEISAAFWESLGHVEIALRNAIDVQLSKRHRELQRSGHWIFDEARELGRDMGRNGRRHAMPYADVDTAVRRVRRNGKPITPDQVISEISFGFWHQMVSRGQMFLWPDLAGAFPGMRGRNQSNVSQKVAALREVRNRIGHHHRIWSIDIDAKYRDLLEVASYIDPSLESWITGQSRIMAQLERRP